MWGGRNDNIRWVGGGNVLGATARYRDDDSSGQVASPVYYGNRLLIREIRLYRPNSISGTVHSVWLRFKRYLRKGFLFLALPFSLNFFFSFELSFLDF